MAVRIMLKSGAAYVVEAYLDDVVKDWLSVDYNINDPAIRTYSLLHHGIPLPKISIDIKQIEHIRQER